jgi:hypothetical protein
MSYETIEVRRKKRIGIFRIALVYPWLSRRGIIMSKKRVANKDISTYIDKLEIVEGSNIFTENSGKLPDNPETDDNHYIVYSYGWHFPMYIYCRQADLWYGNSDRYSVSTTKHQIQARPHAGVDSWLSTNEMKDMIQCGSTLEFLIARARSVVTLRQRG